MDLSGKVALITGGGTGIGAACADVLSGDGATVVICGRHMDVLEKEVSVIREVGGDAHAIEADISDQISVNDMVAEIMERWGQIDVLVNNAARGGKWPIFRFPVDEWDNIMAVNLRGPFLCSQAVLPYMRERGRGYIFNIISDVVETNDPGFAAYATSKWGLLGFTKILDNECRPFGIRVHAITPGAVATSFWEKLEEPQPDEVMERMVMPQDIAETIRWLVSLPEHIAISEVVIKPFVNPWG